MVSRKRSRGVGLARLLKIGWLSNLRRNSGFLRSMSRWLKERDANTKYFHASVKSRGRKNAILALSVGDKWVEGVTEVRSEIVNYFSTHFSETTEDHPTLDGIVFQGLSSQEVGGLTTSFSEVEIKDVVVNSDGNKSPGPDGFNFSFFKRFWDLLKDEIRIMFDQFFVSADLPRNFSSYFITLIPKVDVPHKIGDFRPISLIGSLYKLVYKVLARILALVMPSLISPNQSPFINGRQLVDGVVAINEWRSWIRACVFTGNLAVLVNGCPTEEINIQRGLKQGDPLAPFLFLLVVEGLSATIRRAEEIGMFKGFKVGNSGLSVSHLQYAYDTIFLGEASVENLWTFKTVLRCFEMASGLKVNFSKSSVMGVNVSSDFLYLAERFLHCSVGSIPFAYLEPPVGANHRKESTWKPLLMALSNACKSLETNCSASKERKIAWVSWDKICRPKNRGGLGIQDFRVVNLVLLGKWRWRVIAGGVSSWWKDVSLLGGTIVASSDWFSEGVVRKVSNGSSTAFWFDPWVGGLPLKDRYHRLFQELLHVVTQSPSLGMEDSWVLTLDPTGSYSVKSAYLAITSVEVAPEPNSLLTRVWKSWAPSKVIVFSWQLLQDRVPTRQNLLRHHVLREASLSLCALCGDFVESINHLFITCDCISIFWYNLARWLGFELVSPNRIASLFEWFLGLGVCRKSRLGWLLIWHAAVWSIWISRNDLIFARGTISVESLIDKVKLSSYKCFLAKNTGYPCSFYEWEVQPVMCWSR
ncbi:hypothetical protein TSUD_211700 [Trifolium subterraneum]|uniref:Reverse transcriptase domain-containing protein n=1 Tax=Trifolium subterraneum TaxID=3900 RepID=A0A2Z6MKE9_TRISU|nr:hypothetical protein TSUD_211700 [Trifolium subterraneum]